MQLLGIVEMEQEEKVLGVVGSIYLILVLGILFMILVDGFAGLWIEF